MFALSLKEDANIWFQVFGKGEISCFAGLIEAFFKYWSPKGHEWMPRIEYIKGLFENLVVEKSPQVDEPPHVSIEDQSP